MKSTYVNFVEFSFEEEERLLQRELSNRIGSGIQNPVAKPDPVIKELLPAQTLDRHQQSQKPNTAQKSHSTTLCAVIVRQSSGQQWTVMNSRGVRGVHEGRSSWRRWRSLEIIYITAEIWTLKTKGRVGGAFKHRRHAHWKCPLRFLSQVDFECSFQKTKKIANSYLIQSHRWLERSVRLSSAAKFKSVFAGWRWARDRRVCTALRIITNHTRCCWAYGCNDQSEVFRWVIAKIPLFSSLARWLNTTFWWILSSETTKCKCVIESVRYSFYSVNSFSDFNGSFWERSNSRLSVKMLWLVA